MKKLSESLEKFLVPLATKLSSNKYLGAISGGFTYLLPVVMIGALFTLFSSLNIEAYQTFITNIGLKNVLSFASTVTTDMLAVYAVFLIGKSLGEKLGYEKESTIAGALSLVVFLMMIPLTPIEGDGGVITNFLGTKYLGAPGLFSAIIIALIVSRLYILFIEKNIVIKMPDSVPPTISKSFSGILPGLAIVLIFSFVRQGFSSSSYGDFNTCIYTIIQSPLVKLGASPVTYCILIAMCSIMWFFGIHGGLIVMPILSVLYLPGTMENLAAFQAGAEIPNIIAQSTWMLLASLGGAGGTLGLCILMLLKSKSSRYKTLGKLAIAPGICGINEPITFGFPMVLNTVMLIPMIVTPIVTFLISYACMSAGIVPYPNGVQVALGTPAILSGLMCIGWQGAVLQVVLILIQIGIYLPFFNIVDKQALKEEQTNVKVAE